MIGVFEPSTRLALPCRTPPAPALVPAAAQSGTMSGLVALTFFAAARMSSHVFGFQGSSIPAFCSIALL